MAMSDPVDVIIIGAGISGLTLAQSLSKRNISYRLYESDPSLHARPQGYRVRISDEGIQALEQSLSEADYSQLEASCSLISGPSNIPQAILDAKTGGVSGPLFRPGTKLPIAARPQRKPLSADRGVLRKTLLEGIQDGVVFGQKFEYYDEVDGGVVAHFESGLDVKGSALVGADGTWSRVRRTLMPSFTLLDTEARLIFGKTNLSEELARGFSPTALQGLTFIRDIGLNCLLEPMRFNQEIMNDLPADYVYWVLFLRCDSDNVPQNILELNSTEIAELARRLTSHWQSSLRSLFDNAHQSSVLRILSVKPDIPDWAQESNASTRVTLIGDAAHSMCPTAALGATTALRDAHTLSSSFGVHGIGPEALRDYEGAMRGYSREALNSSLVGGRQVFQMRPFEELPEVQSRSYAKIEHDA
jgi:2-polyprenyl-6-methoxyphenol hydroxylase-like FAD-dependent oxidoreductase